MKLANIFLAAILALSLSPNLSLADIKGSPFEPHIDERFDEVEDAIDTLEGSTGGLNADQAEASGIAKKYARVEYDVSVDGGGSSPSTHSLGVTLPAGAVVTSILVYINTTFSGGDQSESLALICNAGVRDLMDWQDIGVLDANSVLFGGLVPTAATAAALLKGGATPAPEQTGVVSIPTACEVKAIVRNEAGYTPYSAGKLTAVIEYFNKN